MLMRLILRPMMEDLGLNNKTLTHDVERVSFVWVMYLEDVYLSSYFFLHVTGNILVRFMLSEIFIKFINIGYGCVINYSISDKIKYLQI